MAELDHKDIARLLGVYESAVFDKDVEAFMRLYDPAVRVFDTWGHWSYEGAPAWRAAVEGWFTSLGPERVKVRFAEVQGALGKDMGWVGAFVSYTALAADGTALRTMDNRLSWALRTVGHVPRIVHEHTSAPLGFEDQKAILARGGTGR